MHRVRRDADVLAFLSIVPFDHAARCHLLVRKKPKVAVIVEHKQGHQQQHAADQREEEKLDRGILAPRAAPDADQKVHRQQHHFPKHVKQEEIKRQEHAQHTRFQQQKQHAVALHMLRDRPTRAHRQHAEERREQNQRKTDAVEAEEVMDVPRRDPVVPDHALHVGCPIANRPDSPPCSPGLAGSAIHSVMMNTATVTKSENCFMNRSLRTGTMHNTSAPTAGRKITELNSRVKKVHRSRTFV